MLMKTSKFSLTKRTQTGLNNNQPALGKRWSLTWVVQKQQEVKATEIVSIDNCVHKIMVSEAL